MSLKVLGINYGGHDTSASITINGRLVAACEQERYDKIKHSRAFPIDAIKDCLKISKLKIKDIDVLAYGSNPDLMLKERYLKLPIKFPRRKKFFDLDKERIIRQLNLEEILRKKLNFKNKIDFNNHHLSHLYSAYYPSGFKDSLVVSYDGIGEIHASMICYFKNKRFKLIESNNKFPNSLGIFYSAITYFLGWKNHCDEGIVMGLAPFGNPNKKIKGKNISYYDVFKKIITLDKNKVNFKINLDWISYHEEKNIWLSKKFFRMFGPKRQEGGILNSHHMNIAAALQKRLEYVVLEQLKFLKKKYKINKLCIAGGVGLNCSMNGKIVKSGLFNEVFVQPAAGDAGVAYGSCLVSTLKRKKISISKNRNFYTGFREDKKFNIIKKIIQNKLKFRNFRNKIYDETAKLLSEGKIIGWYQGPSEFGPRALGNRSILCKPFPDSMRDHINKKVKFREYFRPFAPAILAEKQKKYFDLNQKSEHMLIACSANKLAKKQIPATVHIDGTSRVQTVTKSTNHKFWKLLKSFEKKTSIPVLLNTSFNIKGEPIVNDIDDALRCFKKYNIDFLVIDEFLIEKK